MLKLTILNLTEENKMRRCVILLCRIVGTRVRLPSAPLNNLINKQKMKVDSQTIKDFNLLRQNNLSKRFSREEIKELLFNNIAHFSRNNYIITILVRHNALDKWRVPRANGSCEYSFTKTPVHVTTLSRCIFELKDYVKRQNRKHNSKNKETQSEITNIHPITEEYCIQYLKDRGYVIFKQF